MSVRETGLYYLQSRYYNPTWGRFLNADVFVATGQGLLGNNMFAYCRSNPVIRKDATGTDDICVTTQESDDNPMNDLGTIGGRGGGGGGRVAGVSSSYYAMQNVRAYDNWWRNSGNNPNMTWSNGAAGNGVPIGTGGNTGSSGASTQTPSTVPYPGDDPSRCDVPGFDWRGSGDPGSSKGNFYNSQSGEWLHPDLSHPMPIGPHWDYGRHGSREVYRVFPDGTMSIK